jgi:hypothetical protein
MSFGLNDKLPRQFIRLEMRSNGFVYIRFHFDPLRVGWHLSKVEWKRLLKHWRASLPKKKATRAISLIELDRNRTESLGRDSKKSRQTGLTDPVWISKQMASNGIVLRQPWPVLFRKACLALKPKESLYVTPKGLTRFKKRFHPT